MDYQNSLLDDENESQNDEISNEVIQSLPANAFWVKFAAVIYFISNLIIIGTVSFLLSFLPATWGVSVIISCLIYFSISLWANFILFDYGNKITEFIRSKNINDFANVIQSRKLFWKISVWLIISLVVLAFLAIFFVFFSLQSNRF